MNTNTNTDQDANTNGKNNIQDTKTNTCWQQSKQQTY